MKILLDESLPRKLKYDFGIEHEVWTVKEKGWLGAKNGVLLELLENDGFEVFVTVDQNLQYPQNFKTIRIKIFVLCGKDNKRETLHLLITEIFIQIAEGDLKTVNEIWKRFFTYNGEIN
jgi:hypothetical protein